MASLDVRIAALATMSSAQLRSQWRQLFKIEAPDVSRKLLALAIAWRLQEKAMGGLTLSTKRELAGLGAQYAKTGELSADPGASLKVGSRLVRNWHGEAHHVTIRDDGYLYRDKTYSSLSRIACTITGTNWSGPRFFGLRSRSGRAANG